MLKKSWLLVTARPDLYRAKLVFHLFLMSLAIFFAAGMLSYCVIRASAFRNPDQIAYVPLTVPKSFWVSTLFLIAVSVFLHRAVGAIRRNHVLRFQRFLAIAGASAVVFTAIQAFGMRELLEVHFSQSDGTTKSYGICFTMAFLHALHVLGGLVFLAYVMVQGIREKYDHERHWTVDNCASYWHFLDVVWVLMLVTFSIAR